MSGWIEVSNFRSKTGWGALVFPKRQLYQVATDKEGNAEELLEDENRYALVLH
jgi:hypothetical protein